MQLTRASEIAVQTDLYLTQMQENYIHNTAHLSELDFVAYPPDFHVQNLPCASQVHSWDGQCPGLQNHTTRTILDLTQSKRHATHQKTHTVTFAAMHLEVSSSSIRRD